MPPPPVHSVKSAALDDSRFPLAISPEPLSLGTLRPGQTAEAALTVRNIGDDVVAIERIETSCPCLKVGPAPIEVGPGQAARLKVRFDSTEEPEFRGRLTINLLGMEADGKPAFQAQTRLEIKAGK